jgi:hypothetical protein
MKRRRRSKHPRHNLSTAELEEFKAFLGPLAADYTDSELRDLRRELQAMAEILLDLYISKRNGGKEKNIPF